MAISGKMKLLFLILGIAYIAAIVSFFIGKSEQDESYKAEREAALDKIADSLKGLNLVVHTDLDEANIDGESAKKLLEAVRPAVQSEAKAAAMLKDSSVRLFPESKTAEDDMARIHAENISVLAAKIAELKLVNNAKHYYIPSEKCEEIFKAVASNSGDDAAVKALSEIKTRVGGAPADISPAKVEKVFEEIAPRGNVISLNYTMIMQILNFLIFISILYALLWKPVVAFLDKRRAEVKANIESAESSREEARKVLGQYNKKLEEAREESLAIISRAEKEAQTERREILEKAQHEATFVIDKSREQIEAESNSAMLKLRTDIAKLATNVASKVIEREVNEKDHHKFVEDFVKDK